MTMASALWKNQPVCILGYLFPCCSAMYIRYNVLGNDLSQYSCCQGYFDMNSCQAGDFGEQSCPQVCLCLEAWCCVGPSISASRMSLMDQYDLRPDPVDNQIVRLTNCLTMLSCICDMLSICIEDAQQFASVLDAIAQCAFYCTLGCMVSQVHNELQYRRDGGGIDVSSSYITPSQYGSTVEAEAVPVTTEMERFHKGNSFNYY